MIKRIFSLFLIISGSVLAQSTPTLFNLQTQSKNPDFSSFTFTRPVSVGTSLPSTCLVGQLFYNSAATAGANLYACTAGNTWTVQGISGATMASQLNDFAAVLSGSTVTVGATCSAATPCNVRFGNTVRSFVSAATLTLSGSASGTVYIYIDPSGTLTAGSSVALTCSGCTYAVNVNSFPAGSIPLYSWTVTSGSFNSSGKTDMRALLSTKILAAGSGIQVIESAGTSTIAIDPTIVGTYVVTVPATSGASCTVGQFSTDASFYYFCVAANTWKRVALGAF